MFDPESRLQTITKQEGMIRKVIQEYIIENAPPQDNCHINHKRRKFFIPETSDISHILYMTHNRMHTIKITKS
jgi:hypothetical protein